MPFSKIVPQINCPPAPLVTLIYHGIHVMCSLLCICCTSIIKKKNEMTFQNLFPHNKTLFLISLGILLLYYSSFQSTTLNLWLLISHYVLLNYTYVPSGILHSSMCGGLLFLTLFHTINWLLFAFSYFLSPSTTWWTNSYLWNSCMIDNCQESWVRNSVLRPLME